MEKVLHGGAANAQELPTRCKVEKVLENLVSQKIMCRILPVRGIVV
jgi:hypothetical protein